MKKEKSRKNSFSEAMKNNVYMLKLAYEACPIKVIGRFISTVLWYSVIYVS